MNDAPEIDADNYTSFGALMADILTDATPMPVWIRIKRSRYLITPESKRDVCRGLIAEDLWKSGRVRLAKVQVSVLP